MNFPGTVSISPEVLINLLVEVMEALVKHGLRHIFLFNGHGGNASSLEIAGRKIFERYGIHAGIVSFMHAILRRQPLPQDLNLARHLARDLTGHGSLIETSLVMAIDPCLVHVEKADLQPVDAALALENDLVSLPYMIEDKSNTGVFGNIQGACAEIGEEMWQEGAIEIAKQINILLKRTQKMARRWDAKNVKLFVNKP